MKLMIEHSKYVVIPATVKFDLFQLLSSAYTMHVLTPHLFYLSERDPVSFLVESHVTLQCIQYSQ